MDQMRLGVLDGDTGFGATLVGFLGRHGIAAELHADAGPLLAGLGQRPPSLVVVHEDRPDTALPMLHVIRTFSRVPCVVVGAADDPDRSIRLLDAGADDMMPRETPLPIMLARMRALLRRAAWGLADEPSVISDATGGSVDDRWRLIRQRRELLRPDGTECHLTTAEFDLFCLLVDSGPGPVSRELICRSVFRRRWRSEDRTVDNLVVRLRRKLDDEARATVRTLHGRGYAFVGFPDAELHEA
ncbi:MAG: response regulator transcription factor [Acetobacteraceae bacterium]|nr:response regulator transcription factor [Acetobacteraceae bacterium]